MLKIGITGGIGSGKSTLCRIFQDLGVPIFYSDIEAKQLMVNDAELREAIIAAFGAESYINGELNRSYLAEVVFGDNESLERLNSIVHPRVRSAFEQWCLSQDAPYVILESAILFEAKFENAVDKIVCVLSPKPLRIERVMSRDSLTAEEVESRIASQMGDNELNELSDYCVVNFELDDLEDAAQSLDKRFRYESSK